MTFKDFLNSESLMEEIAKEVEYFESLNEAAPDFSDLKKGAFTKWCKQNGFGDVNCKCICAGLAKGGVIAKRANFANTFGKHDCDCPKKED